MQDWCSGEFFLPDSGAREARQKDASTILLKKISFLQKALLTGIKSTLTGISEKLVPVRVRRNYCN
jgi:hypothetical protein